MDIASQSSLALKLFHSGNTEEAYSTALELIQFPHTEAEMSHLCGACLHQLKRHDDALPFLKRAILVGGFNPSYLNTYGVVLRKACKPEQAVRAYTKATELDPNFADVYYNCGNLLSEMKRKDEAEHQFLKCLELNSSHNNAHHNLANIYRDENKLEEALHHYELSDKSQHDNPDMHCNWGLALQLTERWSAAIEHFEIAITQKSDHSPSYVNLGSALSVQERFDEACQAFRRGVELDPSCNDAKFNLALTLLTIGQLEEGWKFYETRLHLPDKVITPFPEIPVWDGDIEISSPLLVWAEQGYGDNIQFVRYIPILMRLGVDVVLSTRKPLMKLFRECLQPEAPPIVEHRRDDLKGFKHHIPLLSLPRVLGTTLSTIPRTPGYISCPSVVPSIFKINRPPFALNIGLVWASGIDNKDMYEDKSIQLSQIIGIFDQWRSKQLVTLHSLQVGPDSEQLTPWIDEWGVFDWSSKLSSFYDTSCVISQLDLLITVDTAVAHLAAAMDKPVWLILQHNADFRWLRGRSDSPWYNSMSLYRQHRLGDWSSVITDIQDDLIQLLG